MFPSARLHLGNVGNNTAMQLQVDSLTDLLVNAQRGSGDERSGNSRNRRGYDVYHIEIDARIFLLQPDHRRRRLETTLGLAAAFCGLDGGTSRTTSQKLLRTSAVNVRSLSHVLLEALS